MYLFISILLLRWKIDKQVWCGYRKSSHTWRLRGEAKKSLAVSYKSRGARLFQDPPSLSRSLTLTKARSFKWEWGPLEIGISAALLGMACRLADSVFLFTVPFFFFCFFFCFFAFFISHFVFLDCISGPPSKARCESKEF